MDASYESVAGSSSYGFGGAAYLVERWMSGAPPSYGNDYTTDCFWYAPPSNNGVVSPLGYTPHVFHSPDAPFNELCPPVKPGGHGL